MANPQKFHFSDRKTSEGNKPQNFGQSFKLSITPNIDTYVKSDGTASIFLLVRVNGRKTNIPLHIYSDPKHWDRKKKELKNSHPQAVDYNLLIRQSAGRVNEIAVRHRLQGGEISAAFIKKQFGGAVRSGSFLDFMDAEIQKRKVELDPKTIRHHECTLRKLKVCFHLGLSFAELNPENVAEFNRYMAAYNLKPNTRTANLKRLKVYARIAMQRGLIISDPFEHTSFTYTKGDREALTREELRQLENLYEFDFLNDTTRHTLQCFLFSCYTGVRIGDLPQVCKRNIINGELTFQPEKTEHVNKWLRIPLSDAAKHYLNTGNATWHFKLPADQTINRHLKIIATLCGIKKQLTYHVSRHTFATLFLESGGDVEVLQELLGHSDIATTMVYVHISTARRAEQIKKLGKM